MGGMSTRRFEPRPHHRRITVLSGAGLSAAAGLATFRGPGGIWDRDPDLEAAMQADRLPESLPVLWRVWGGVFTQAVAAGPTRGHRAIAAMEATVLTQNVDELHQQAGSQAVAELHGSAARAECVGRQCDWSMRLDLRGSEQHPVDTPMHYGAPAACPNCGAAVRPAIVLFGEQLPADALHAADRATQNCDLFIAVGTSNTVAPASLLAPAARRAGATTVCIDPYADREHLAGIFDHVIEADAHEVLAEWAQLRQRENRNPFLDPFG